MKKKAKTKKSQNTRKPKNQSTEKALYSTLTPKLSITPRNWSRVGLHSLDPQLCKLERKRFLSLNIGLSTPSKYLLLHSLQISHVKQSRIKIQSKSLSTHFSPKLFFFFLSYQSSMSSLQPTFNFLPFFTNSRVHASLHPPRLIVGAQSHRPLSGSPIKARAKLCITLISHIDKIH